MKTNMGNADRIIRIVISVVLGVLYFTGTVTGSWAIVLLVIGIIFALTGLVGYCPLYGLLGTNTCSKKG